MITHGGSNALIARGTSHGGDTEWTEVPITFQAPDKRLTRIYVCFVNFGRGTGIAWFDDLKLVEITSSKMEPQSGKIPRLPK